MNDNDTRPNPVTDHLDLWSSITVKKATSRRGSNGKVSPYGIQKLRELILELAVRGKLVGQDARGFQIEVVARCDGEVPFDITESWNWASVGDFAETRLGKMLDKVKNKGKPFRYLRNINVRWFEFDLSDVKEMRFEDTEREEFSLRRGDVLICEGGYPGRAAVWDERETDIYFQKALHRVRLPEAVNPHYFVLVLRESANSERINSYFTGAGIQHFTGKGLKSFLVPLPSSAEQHRIVAKVDELMALCDQLEQQQTDSLQAHHTLVETLLRTLVDTGHAGHDGMDAAASATSATVADNAQASRQAGMPRATVESLQQAWNRIAEHFDTLFTTEASIDQLKQTILQLAVMGKLVPQDPNDEPASVSLKRMANERKAIVADRKIRGAKPPSTPSPSDVDYELPPKWELCSLGQVTLVTDPNPSHRYPDYSGGTIPLLSTREFLGENGWSPVSAKLTTQDFWQFQKEICDFSDGDIVFARKGRLGLPRFLPLIERFTFSHTLFVIKPMSGLEPAYLLWLLRRAEVIAWLTSEMNRNVGVPTLGKAKTERLPVPLPPLAEQHRIVAKVDELMTLCDFLKACIQDAQTTQVHLADAVVEQAVG